MRGLLPVADARGTGRGDHTGLGGASSRDKDQAPLLADIISFDGPRLRVVFPIRAVRGSWQGSQALI